MNVFEQVVAALSDAPTQDQRFVKLHTQLGRDVLVAERIEVVEAIGPTTDGARAGYRIVVHALSADAHIELKQLIGQPAQVELLTSQSRTELRPWHGHITEAAMVGSDGGLARFRIVIEPWLAFLARRQDSWVFQSQTVQQIVDEVFADYQGQGTLMPAWRWELADAGVYPQRSLCVQYQESDLDFVQRLLREEGLFYWFEHSADAHMLVIADHNGAFKANAQPRVRYTQSGAALKEDSVTRWHRGAQLRSASLALASPDYRSLSLRPVSQQGVNAPLACLTQGDIPGAYAYEDLAQGERLALRQMQAIDAAREHARAVASVRTTAPATSFTLLDHPVHDGSDQERDVYVTLSARHTARNNLSADLKAQVESLVGAIQRAKQDKAVLPNETDEPLYQCELTAQRLAVPVRPVALDAHGQPDPRLHPRPTIHGVQTAIVVGLGEPVHTDRDHRIKVQFHWQRGANSSHRLTAGEGGDNAPASDASGTWVRVAESVAGANWGSNFTPRLGQEVLVAFLDGDIDRPVVVGSVYNGAGQPNAQANKTTAGAATATGNANPWFPGDKNQGKLQAHQHGAVLAGFKTQELSTSQSGTGGYNQLAFDDSPGANRIELSTTSAATRLQLGHLLNQNDNQRLQPRGHGLDLSTAAWGAVRAGGGMILSAHGKPGSQAASQQFDSREPQAAIEQAREITKTLCDSAQAHNAKTAAEPAADKLPSVTAMTGTLESLKATDSRNAQADSGLEEAQIGGGAGTVAAPSRADLVVAAPGGVAVVTPGNTLVSAGNTISMVASQDLHAAAQANHVTAAAYGIVLYTYGKAQNASKPNTETGIKLHSASGSVNTQSQSASTRLTADKSVEVSSTTAMVKIAAPQHVLLTAAGAALHIEGGNITLKGPGKIEFKAAMKELTGPGSASASLSLPEAGEVARCALKSKSAAEAGAGKVSLGT